MLMNESTDFFIEFINDNITNLELEDIVAII